MSSLDAKDGEEMKMKDGEMDDEFEDVEEEYKMIFMISNGFLDD